MLKPAVFVCLDTEIQDMDGDFFGVDRGAFFLAEKGIKMKVAIGDFDSVDSLQRKKIEGAAERVIKLNPVKDISDSQAAIEYAVSEGYQKGILLGGLGKRFDHAYVNFNLITQGQMDLTMIDQNNKIYCLEKGKHDIDKLNYKYLSIFAVGKLIISVSGVRYPLNREIIDEKNLIGLSNEILDMKANIHIIEGKAIIIQSRD